MNIYTCFHQKVHKIQFNFPEQICWKIYFVLPVLINFSKSIRVTIPDATSCSVAFSPVSINNINKEFVVYYSIY
jgi:hypothetical protein